MVLSLLAALVLRPLFGQQQNPPGTMVMPTQAAFYAPAGATASVEIWNSQGQVVPFVDAIGVKRSVVTVAFPSGTAVGLGWEITQTAPDMTNLLTAVSSSQYSCVVRMVSGSATVSPVGTYDSSAGAGNGIASGYPAPSASTPTAFMAGIAYRIDPGAVITTVGSAVLPLNAAQESGGNLASLAGNQPVAASPLSLALADIGGSGCTVGVEFVDSAGVTLPLVDSAAVSWSAVTVTLGVSAKAGLAYLVLHTAPDSSHLISGLPSGAVGVRLRCLSGASGVPTLAINTGGLVSGAAGSGGTGFNTGFAPSSSSPVQFYVGDADRFGRLR